MGMGSVAGIGLFDGFRGINYLVSRSGQLEPALLPIDQPSKCLEISREISTIDVFPVNSNLTFPNEEK